MEKFYKKLIHSKNRDDLASCAACWYNACVWIGRRVL